MAKEIGFVNPLHNSFYNKQVNAALRNMKKNSNYSLNTILYGPPGTGKTYNTVYYAVGICEGKSYEDIKKERYYDVLQRYDRLKNEGRIAFTTFHQSYGYEEFVEGIRPVEKNNEVSYSVVPGVFKELCEKAAKPKLSDCDDYVIKEKPHIWGARRYSIGTFFSFEIANGQDEGNISIKWLKNNSIDKSVVRSVRQQINMLEQQLSEGDIIVAFNDEDVIESVGVYVKIISKEENDRTYSMVSEVQWLGRDKKLIRSGLVNNEMPSDGWGVFNYDSLGLKTISEMVQDDYELNVVDNDEPYVLIIDEINRGNISKILGELITLIEPSKRKGNENQLSAILPYSKKEFSVPNNVYIVGTMNTADRSIALMDTALRRRFKFVEMMTDYECLEGFTISGINIEKMLRRINERIELLYDREHVIGHSYFIKIKGIKNPQLSDLADVFLNEIIPLLQEYFFDDYEKIILVLGDNKKKSGERFIKKENIDTYEYFGETEDRVITDKRYVIDENVIKTNSNAYVKIYS